MDFRADCQGKTDEQIVPLVFDHAHYFGCLMERYEAKLLRYIMRLSAVSLEEAEDILQEVFIKVYRSLNDFDPTLKFSSWIYRITRNHVISYHRKTSARPVTVSFAADPVLLETLASEVDIPAQIDRDFLRANLTSILNQLDHKYREILILRYLEEKDYQEISDILRKPVSTVGTMLNRAKKQCYQIITKQSLVL